MATVPRTDVTRTGLVSLAVTLASTTLALAASSGGDEYPNDDRTILVVQNGTTAAVTVTATAQQTVTTPSGYGELANADITLAVAAASTPGVPTYGVLNVPQGAFNNSSGRVEVGYSDHTSIRVAALRFPPTG